MLTLIKGQGLRCNCYANGSLFQMYESCPIHGGRPASIWFYGVSEPQPLTRATIEEALRNLYRRELIEAHGRPMYLAPDPD